jgi:hypothetical protein
MYRFLYLLSIAMFISFCAVAQQPGELENVEIQIVKERKNTLPEAERKFNKVPPQASEPISPAITYSFLPVELQLPLVNLPVRPLKLKKESVDESERRFISAGYGNFASPYIEAFITNKSSAKTLVGAHALIDIWAKGPIDKKNSGNGRYGFSLFANSYGEKVKAGAHLNYDQSYWHFYGYPAATSVEPKDIRQQFKRFNLGGTFANASVSDYNYQLKADFSFLSDSFEARETKVDFDYTSDYALANKNKIGIDAAYQIISREDLQVNAKPRSLFATKASYSFSPIENLLVEAGFKIAYENDTIDKDFHFYPHVLASYCISKKVRVKGMLTGNMQSVSLHTLTTENPWLAPNVGIAHTNEAFILGGSIESTVGKWVMVEAGTSVASLRNLYFYYNDVSDQARFITQYDKGATERTNFFASINFAFAQQTSASLRADWFGYNTDTLSQAWHRPTQTIRLDASHGFFKKLKLSTSLITLGGMKAFDAGELNTLTLKSAIDLSVKADYFLSEKFLIFLHGANLFNTDYNLYYNYPARGLQVRAGFSWSF